MKYFCFCRVACSIIFGGKKLSRVVGGRGVEIGRCKASWLGSGLGGGWGRRGVGEMGVRGATLDSLWLIEFIAYSTCYMVESTWSITPGP